MFLDFSKDIYKNGFSIPLIMESIIQGGLSNLDGTIEYHDLEI